MLIFLDHGVQWHRERGDMGEYPPLGDEKFF